MLPDNPQQMALFVRATKDASFGVRAAWKERNGWETKAASLGKHLTEADAALCNGVICRWVARVKPRVDKGEGRSGWHNEYGSL